MRVYITAVVVIKYRYFTAIYAALTLITIDTGLGL
jgi:hypothetical protein